jgi:transposase-like protein
VLLQKRSAAEAAKRFFRSLLARHGGEPRTIDVTPILRSCPRLELHASG